jgi:hypothetical protein
MYNRLTIIDKLSHKKAIVKIYEDHKHLQGFSQRNIRRSLTSLNNPHIPHRNSRKIRPRWPNSHSSESEANVTEQEKVGVFSDNLPANKDELEYTRNPNSEKIQDANCPNSNILLVETQKLEQEKNRVIKGYEETLQIIQEQEQRISEIQDAKSYSNQPGTTNYGVKDLEQDIALLYDPLQKAMASAFKLKENTVWLTIRFSKGSRNITAVYTGKKSSRVSSSHSILSGHGQLWIYLGRARL